MNEENSVKYLLGKWFKFWYPKDLPEYSQIYIFHLTLFKDIKAFLKSSSQSGSASEQSIGEENRRVNGIKQLE